MSLTHEEWLEIDRKISESEQRQFEANSEKFVLVNDCNDVQEKNNSRFSNDDTRIKLFEQKIKGWEWIFKLIATGTIGTLVTSIFSLILKVG